MSRILSIETSTEICSVALTDKNNLLASKTVMDKNIHSSMLTVFIREILQAADMRLKDLHAVAVSKGPGSFTGLRIGVSVAKGIAWGLDLPLISVSTLLSLASSVQKRADKSTILCPLIDARNDEFYYAVYDYKLNEIVSPDAGLISEEIFSALPPYQKILFFGDRIDKISAQLIQIPKSEMLNDVVVDAASLASIAYQKFLNREFENISTFEPFYLRDFKARNLGKKIEKILYPEKNK